MTKNKNKNLAAKPEEGNTQPEATGADQSVSPLSSGENPEHQASYGEMMQRRSRKDYTEILKQKREERQNYAREFKPETDVNLGTEAEPEANGDSETTGGSGETA